MTDNSADILREFIADEDRAFAERRQGKFWPRNHYLVSPLATKASKFLAPEEVVDFFFHYLRVTGAVPAVGEKDVQPLIEAYRRLLPHLDIGGVIQMAGRPEMLFIFGFDDTGTLPSGITGSAKELKERIKLVTQVGNYTSQPGQRDKMPRFARFADQAGRVLETLQHLHYWHDRRYGEDLYDIANLSFWGMVFIALLNETTRPALLADMFEGRYELVKRDQQMTMLNRYVETVLPVVKADEGEFHALAKRLGNFAKARRDATESVAFARHLQLPFEDGEDWMINIAIGLRNATGAPLIAPTNVQLVVRPEPDWQWELSVTVDRKRKLSESERGVLRNDLRSPPLGRGNLESFPQWLRQVRERNGLDFDAETADIRVGRSRSAAKLIARWLAS